MPYFRIDNDIFLLRLDPYEFQVYAYLVSCAGKKGECWPSTNTIARALSISQSTVISKIDSLVRRQLIDKRTTTRRNKSGKVSSQNVMFWELTFVLHAHISSLLRRKDSETSIIPDILISSAKR